MAPSILQEESLNVKKILIIKSLLSILIFIYIIPLRTNAGIPTIDVANIVQTTISAVENIHQVAQLYEQIDNQINQIENQIKQFENLNGDYFKDILLNTSEYKKARRWVPKT